MKHTLFTMLFPLILFSHVHAQNIDSFTVSDNAPNVYDSVYLINLSTNYTSLEWNVSSSSFHPFSGFPNDSVVIGRFNKTGCYDISLIVGRGTNYDTITKTCAVRSYDRDPPTLTLLKPVDTLEVYDHFIDRGYTVSDSYCDASGIKIYTSGSIDSSILGLNSYKIWAVDCEGNSSDTLTQEVWVLDRIPPILIWTGPDTFFIKRYKSLPPDFDTAMHYWDNYDTTLLFNHSRGTYFTTYMISKGPGCYDIIFNAADKSGNLSNEIIIWVCTTPSSIEENNTLNDLHIYPNPNSGHFTIENRNLNQILNSISIFNQMGQEVYFKKIDDQLAHQIEIDLQQPAGLYFILVKSAKSTITYKVLLE